MTGPDHSKNVNELSGLRDFPALKQIGHALWRTEGARGAAVLVGAGMSRGARLSSADMPLPPLWGDLARAMRDELYRSNTAAAPSDPLRLAEEYRTYFGQAALDDFIRTHIADSSWAPSANQHALLDLPWSDVLTTNYDTLLERAARKAERHYDPVLFQSDLPRARAPRIVKLHGSIGSSVQFIIAEEDYRTYPTANAAFVNLARQVFVENELCLIGFSGDDPNFLAWTGWVRDQLGTSARRIYLAGALNLGPAKRKFLEARNIVPIDLHDAVADLDQSDRHEVATNLLLTQFAAMRPAPPHKWSPRQRERAVASKGIEGESNSKSLDAFANDWKVDADSYPGWIVCPFGERSRLRFATSVAPLSAKAIEGIAPEEAARIMVQLCWRYRTALWSLQAPVAKLIERFAVPKHLSRADQTAVALALLRCARESGDRESFDKFAAKIEASADQNSDAAAELRYETAKWARFNMEFAQTVTLANQIVGTDPIWKLRRAGLLIEAGHLTKGEELVSEAVEDLRERKRGSRESLWINSRLAWAEFLAHAFRRNKFALTDWPHQYREIRCDPWTEVERIAAEIKSDVRKKARAPDRITPRFEPGSYNDPSRTISFGSPADVPLCDELDNVLSEAGIPPRLTRANFFSDDQLDALELVHKPTLDWYLRFCRTGVSRGHALIERYFARVAIAALPKEVVEALIRRLKVGRDYWLERIASCEGEERVFATDRANLALELLGRLVIRLSTADAMALHTETLKMWARPELPTKALNVSVKPLLAHSFQAARPSDRPQLVALDLGMDVTDDRWMPDPIDWLGDTPCPVSEADPQFRHQIHLLLEAAGAENSTRSSALTRLAYLTNVGVLDQSELSRFGSVAWSQIDEGDPPLPAPPRLLPHFWVTVPGPEGQDVAETVRRRLFDLSDAKLNENHYFSMIQGARSGKSIPTVDQARVAFDRLVGLRPAVVDTSDVGALMDAAFSGYDHQRESHIIGATLTYALAPHMVAEDLTEERAIATTRFIEDNASLSAAGALVFFLPTQPQQHATLTTLIRRGLADPKKERVEHAGDALVLWNDTALPEGLSCPAQLVEQLISLIELRRAPGLWRLIGCAELLVRKALTTPDQQHRLAVALRDLLVETEYSKVDPQSIEATTISLIRERCVRLAMALRERLVVDPGVSDWIEVGKADPLPEVRFAFHEPE